MASINFIDGLDWAKLLSSDIPLLEIFLRASFMYLSLFILLRVVLRRQVGSMAIPDLLLIVLIADAAQNGMSGGYTSITDGVLLVAVLIFWNYALDLLGYYLPWVERMVKPPAVCIIRNGQMLYRNMRKELITEDDLLAQLRQQGVTDLSVVKEAYMEENGMISVIKHDQED